MKKYDVCYVDGHDLKYKLFRAEAEDPDDAVHKMRESYSEIGDFDHLICDVIEVKE